MLAWWNQETGKGFEVQYPAIVLHAISRDTSNFPHPCLYCQLELNGEEEPPYDNTPTPPSPATLGVLTSMALVDLTVRRHDRNLEIALYRLVHADVRAIMMTSHVALHSSGTRSGFAPKIPALSMPCLKQCQRAKSCTQTQTTTTVETKVEVGC